MAEPKARAKLAAVRECVAAAVIAAIGAPGCNQGSKVEAAPPAALSVELGGCARVNGAGVCFVGAGSVLHVWVGGVAGPGIVAELDRPGPAARVRPLQGGFAIDVTVPADARELRVTAVRGDGQRGAWRSRVEPDDAPAWLGEAVDLRAAGKLDEAEARLAPGLAASASDRERAWATGLVARIALRRNQVERAVALFHEALRLDRVAGLVSDEGADAAALAYLLATRRRDDAGALRVLDEAAPAFARYSEGVNDDLYFRGVVAFESGDFRAALRLLTLATEGAERLAMTEAENAARTMVALQLEYLGRWREAVESLQALDHGAAMEPCARASVLANLGEGRLLATEAEAGDAVGDPMAPLQEALGIYRSTCADPHERAMTLAGAALGFVRRGDRAQARALVSEARGAVAAADADAFLVAGLLEVDGRIALAERRYPEARAAFAREEEIGLAILSPLERWRGAYGKGQALEGRGAREAAVAAYADAEVALDDAVTGVPIGEGRDTFVADREASARSLVDLLVALGRPAEALARARTARGRVIASLARGAHVASLDDGARARWVAALGEYRRARAELATDVAQDWQRPKDVVASVRAERRVREARVHALLDAALSEVDRTSARPALAPLADGALLLAYARGRRGWHAFAATREGVRVVPFDLPPEGAAPERFAALLLAPFAAELRRARELLVLPHGAARAVDLHALPFEGAPLIARLPVRYVLDLPPAEGLPEPAGAAAVLLSDATSDLEGARAEAAAVHAALDAAGTWPVHDFTGLEVTSARMAAELPGAALFHFAGHGIYTGREGWQSALPLARGSRWTVGDILALARAPVRVVLSACEGARSSSGAAEGLGLAQAFLLAGSRVVVAPTRPVNDDVARALSVALYAALPHTGSLAMALREAQTTIRAAGSPDAPVDWAAFRALTP